MNTLPIALCDTLQLVLLLDGVRVRGSLSCVDQLLCQALCYTLDVSECSLTSTDGKKSDSLVNTAERGDIDGLTTDGTSRSNTGGILTGTAVDNGIDGDLDRVLVGHDVDDLESVSDNADSHEFLSVVASVHHEGVRKTLNDRALCLAESLLGETTGRVRDVDRGANLNVITIAC